MGSFLGPGLRGGAPMADPIPTIRTYAVRPCPFRSLRKNRLAARALRYL
jgi:hypothetical protein